MNEKELLTKKFILVKMDDAQITTEDKPIIGTEALATCLGLLLYSEEKKIAIVAHVSSEPMKALNKVFEIMFNNNLLRTTFKYKIIEGYYKEHYKTKELLEKYFGMNIPFDNTSDNDIKIDEKNTQKLFAFDASTGKFVTDKVYYGVEYYMVNQEENEKEEIKPKQR